MEVHNVMVVTAPAQWDGKQPQLGPTFTANLVAWSMMPRTCWPGTQPSATPTPSSSLGVIGARSSQGRHLSSSRRVASTRTSCLAVTSGRISLAPVTFLPDCYRLNSQGSRYGPAQLGKTFPNQNCILETCAVQVTRLWGGLPVHLQGLQKNLRYRNWPVWALEGVSQDIGAGQPRCFGLQYLFIYFGGVSLLWL